MITLTAKINLLSGDNKALSLGSDDLSGNNISSNLRNIVGAKKNGSNPFIIGASKLGDGSTFSSGVDYFIGNQLSDNNGNFKNPYEFIIKSTKKINNLTISFDTINNRYPKEIKVYNVTETKKVINETITTTKEANIKVQNSEFPTWSETVITDENGNEISALVFSVIFDTVYIDGEIAEESKFYEIFYNLVEKINSNDIADINTNMPFYESIDKTITFNGDKITINLILPLSYEEYEQYFTAMYLEYKENIETTETITRVETVYEKGDLIKTYNDDDAIFTLIGLNEIKSCFIEIKDWNTPNYPLVITGIYSEVNIDIDYRNLISISRSIFDRSDLKLPSFGIISNTGNIEFNDINGEIRYYAENLLLQSGLKCEIKLNNTLVDGASENIGLFETDQWNYENDSRVVSVSIKDDLEEWQDINVEGISYDPRVIEHKPFSWLYNYLWEITKENYNMLSFNELDENTQAVLNNTYIQYPLLKSGSLWQQWTKLCQVCQLHIYKNNNGIIVCRYNGGN
jgi:hypothetical protein